MQQCLREGIPFPDRIANAPELIMGLEIFYLAFLELSDSRQIGMSIGHIPWKIVHDYCVAYELTNDQTEEMHHHIREMDAAFLEYQRRKK